MNTQKRADEITVGDVIYNNDPGTARKVTAVQQGSGISVTTVIPGGGFAHEWFRASDLLNVQVAS